MNAKWSPGRLLGVLFIVCFCAGTWVACDTTAPPTEGSTETTQDGGNQTDGITPTETTTPDTPKPDTNTQPEPNPEPRPEPPSNDAGPVENDPPKEEPPREAWNKPEPPTPAPYSGGTCPTLKEGVNTIKSGGQDREVTLFVPPQPKNAPLLFLWHGLGDSPANFSSAVKAATLAQSFGFLVVVPKGVSGPIFPPTVQPSLINLLKQYIKQIFETWAFFGDPKADLALFDDVLSCADAQYDIDNKRVYTSGFSAGAMWSTYLTMHRAPYLAASLLFSGGVMEVDLDLATIPLLNLTGTLRAADIPYVTPQRKIPVMMTAGGPQDIVSMGGFIEFNFQVGTDALGKGLVQDGHFVIQCNHTGAHTIPSDAFTPGINFLLKHVYSDQPSPYKGNLPADMPSYCKELSP